MASLNYREFCKRIKAGDQKGVYAFFGDEDYTKQDALSRLRALASESGFPEFNLIKIRASEFSVAKLTEAVETPPFMSDHKLIEVHSTEMFGAKYKYADEISAALASLDQAVTVVFVCNSGDCGESEIVRSPFGKAMGSKLVTANFERATPSEICTWLGHRMAALKISASPQVTSFLAERCSYSMYSLVSEVTKLAAYVKAHGRAQIEKDDVVAVVAESHEVGAFDLTNAITARRINDALTIYAKMKKRGDNPRYVLGSVISNFAVFASLKTAQENGMPYQEAAKKFSLNEYRVKRLYNDLAKTDRAYIKRALNAFSEADRLSKSVDTDVFLLIEQLICSLR